MSQFMNSGRKSRILYRDMLLPCDSLPREAPVQPKKKRRKVLHHAGLEQLEDEDDDADEYYPESIVPEMDHKQGETAVKEREESGTYNEEQMEDDATELPPSSRSSGRGTNDLNGLTGSPKFLHMRDLAHQFVTT
ncbi:hypothetical protein CRENBAI_012190 [Crenichthys baileyi]|uniref:Uncharacterized protein n=1 Tax=Crenichthys baileyi TaxID=28760 RepID=A0AAV9R0E6_9TELE